MYSGAYHVRHLYSDRRPRPGVLTQAAESGLNAAECRDGKRADFGRCKARL